LERRPAGFEGEIKLGAVSGKVFPQLSGCCVNDGIGSGFGNVATNVQIGQVSAI
jgi:hypothetical protein